LHALPSVPFSEEFQVEFLALYQQAISNLDYVIGEHVWNFADFMTKQGLTRMNGNKKGVFSRDRQPKMVAHFLRESWKNK
jgi:beta-glucuronidase